MKIISIHYVILLTLIPPLYWILLKQQWRKYFLALLSIALVTLFFPLSSLVMSINVIILFFILKYINNKFKIIIVIIPVLFFILYKIYSGHFFSNSSSIFILTGISFYTLKIIHFGIDSMNKQIKNLKFFNLLFYMYYFPVFTAGPIIRYEEFVANLNAPEELNSNSIKQGIRRIALGFVKKFIITLPFFINNTNALSNGLINSTLNMWIAIFTYSIYIYWDFSSYSDIAIGTSLLFNYKVIENFKSPYLKRNITLFWQNWHISLTRWLQSYIFVYLSKFSIKHLNKKFIIVGTGLSQLTTMVVCGFWHGSKFNFILWGIYHGLGLFIHVLWKNYIHPKIPFIPKKQKNELLIFQIISIIITFTFVSIGWIFFSAPFKIAIKNLLILFQIK